MKINDAISMLHHALAKHGNIELVTEGEDGLAPAHMNLLLSASDRDFTGLTLGFDKEFEDYEKYKFSYYCQKISDTVRTPEQNIIAARNRTIEELKKENDKLKEFAIWMTVCGYDFTQHDAFTQQRDELL
jgi:hypothetical protein